MGQAMTRTPLDLNRVSAKALKGDGNWMESHGQIWYWRDGVGFHQEWAPSDDEAQSAMCLDWLIANVQAVQFDSGEMTVSVPMRWNKHYPCRTPAERRMAVLQAVADVEETKNG